MPHTRPTLPKMFTNLKVNVIVICMGYNDSILFFSIYLGTLNYLHNEHSVLLSKKFVFQASTEIALFFSHPHLPLADA